MQIKNFDELSLKLYDEDYNIMIIQIVISSQDYEEMRLNKCSVAHLWYVEINKLISLKFSESQNFNVNLNNIWHVYNHDLTEWFADFAVSIENMLNSENVYKCLKTSHHKQI